MHFTIPITLALATLSVANPIELNTLEARDTLYNCPIYGRISKDNALGVIHQAPPESKTGQGTGSDYPHQFFNSPDKKGKRQIPLSGWDKKCLDQKGQQKKLLEAPVFADKHLYDFQKKKPKENPGGARVIYTADSDKYFCGIIAHTKKNNEGDFALCPV